MATLILLGRKGVILGRTQRYDLLNDRGQRRRTSAHGSSPLKRVHPCDYGIRGSLDVHDGPQNLLRCQRSSLWRGHGAVTTSAPAMTMAIAPRFSPVVRPRRRRGRQGCVVLSSFAHPAPPLPKGEGRRTELHYHHPETEVPERYCPPPPVP